MAQPGVAREPSMEEILASIRRIIESNEPDAAQAAGGAHGGMPVFDLADDEDDMPAEEAEDIHLTIDDELPDFSATAAPRTERSAPAAPALRPALSEPAHSAAAPQPAFQPAAPQPAAREAALQDGQPRRDIEQRSISLADVAARVRAASERSPSDMLRSLATTEPAAPARPVELRPAAAPARTAEPMARAAEPSVRPVEPVARAAAPQTALSGVEAGLRPPHIGEAPQAVAAPQMMAAAPRSAEAELASLAANDRAQQADPLRPAAEAAEPLRRTESVQPEQALAVAAEEAKPLVSAETGLQVARSFGELAEMVHSTAKRSLDEVAEELLRPMLQEWLDDNLPTLVERLVREEIERVARGPRR